ncbi:MAG: FAD-binding protein [Candidatus Obscuribacterales bacterium]|nr:FAD-binding protein [Candidatus Obscuribacterales bacterium]
MSELKQLAVELAQIVGDYHVLSSDVDLSLYESDAETLDRAKPDLVVLPGSTEELSEVLKLANRYKVPFTPRGAGTGLSGGATAIMGGISIAMTRMNRVLKIDPEERMAHVQVGVPNLSVSKAAEAFGLYFAPDPSSQVASTIGGNLAENAGGAHCLKYGMTTSHVLGVKFVLPNGDVTTLGGAFRDSLSLDLLGVLVGSEGTLGIATEAYLRLTPRVEGVQTLLAYFDSLESGGEAVSEIIAAGIIPAAMEMIDRLSFGCVEESWHLGLNLDAGALLIVELDGPPAIIKMQRENVERIISAKGSIETKWAADEKERALIWKARKSAFAALGRLAPHAYVLDGVIPRSKLKEAIVSIDLIGKKYGVIVSNIYHAGDGNLHPALLYDRSKEEEVKNVLIASREILELCVHLGGTLSGEHGIGIEKLLEMPVAFTDSDLEAMARLKRSFNPLDLCNPGKLIPSPKSCGESGRRPLLRYQIIAC